MAEGSSREVATVAVRVFILEPETRTRRTSKTCRSRFGEKMEHPDRGGWIRVSDTQERLFWGMRKVTGGCMVSAS